MDMTHDCGTPITGGALLCPGCGATLALETASIARGQEPSTEPTAPSANVAGATTGADCSVCGRVQPDDETTCHFCGSEFVGEPIQRSASQGAAVSLWLPNGAAVDVPDGVRIELGRESDVAEIRVALSPHDVVSRRHAELVRNGGRMHVRDLGSTNGTFVAGERVSESEVELGAGVVIGLGRSLMLHLHPQQEGAPDG